jgi:hypothetical protein
MAKAKNPSAKKTMIGGGSYNYRGYQIERIDGRWISKLNRNAKTLKDAKFLIDQTLGRFEANGLKKFQVTFYNSAKQTENSVTAWAHSLESAIEAEQKAIALIRQVNSNLYLKSVVEVA